MPGLFVDVFADVVVVHADSAAVLRRWQPGLAAAFDPTRSSAIAWVHPQQASRQAARPLPLWGSVPASVDVHEHSVHYLVKPTAGMSVGLFLDMREVRAWLRSVSAGRTVLNLFAFTCSLGVCASLGGAERVINLDLSRAYLDWGKQNYTANGLCARDQDFVYGEAFDWLDRFARRQQQFDLVIVDPPSFSSHRHHPFSVERDYPRLVTTAAHCVSPGGMLLLATNHSGTTDARFEAWLRSGLEMAERKGAIERRWHEPLPDFPVLAGQTPYLKVRALVLE
jgi:23S rRNA (cytosine1962-C5)-methyltransferase